MAVFLFLRFGLMLLLIGLLPSLFSKNGFLTVNAAAYKKIEGSPLKINISPPSKIVFQKLHSPLLLPCTPSIEENISVTWYRNDEKLQNAHIYGNGTLKLSPNDKANGVYRCLVNDTNLEYGALYSSQTIVEYPVTKRISAQNNQTAFIGEPFLLNCPIESIPMANITWFLGNNSISKKFKENRYVQLQNGSIFIKNITKEYQGKYKCSAVNIFAFKTNRQITIHLFVIESNNTKIRIAVKYNFGQQLIPLMQNNLQYVAIGENLILYCSAYDDVKIEWSFKQLNNDEFIKVNNNSKNYEIRNAAIDQHEGIYKCSTESSSQEFHVIVTIPPVIESKLNSYESSIAAPILFNCTVSSGNPLPNIIWYRNGIQLETSYTIHINRTILRIQSLDLDDAGIYQCFARNVAGESIATGFIALRQMHNIESLPERPKNIKCYPVNSNTLNVTFDNRQAGIFTMMNVYMASKNPSTWVANFPEPLGLHNHFLIQRMLPIFQPFKLFLRSIIVTATRKINGGQPESSVETSMLSEGIDCATQGFDIHSFIYQKGIFIWWIKMKFINVKYYIVQFLTNDTNDNTITFSNIINGTTVPINSSLSHKDIEENFENIYLLNNLIRIYQKNDNKKILKNNYENELLSDNNNDKILNLVVPNNVTGLFIPNTAKITVRIISITEKNEHLEQDYKYLQWKIFKDRTEVKIKSVESRSVNFIWNSLLKISCIYVCYINLNSFMTDAGIAECKNISMNSVEFSVTGLKPRTTYEMTFKECNNTEYFSNIQIYTKDDPPGPISNYTILRKKGLKLIWKPPINPNGEIKHYIIYWTFQNQTHETKIHPIKTTFKFPNVTENDKFNITVRAVGETGLGLPIYIDLNKLPKSLVKENDSNILIDHTLGIFIGVMLSVICVFIFTLLFIRQRRRFKLSSPYTAATGVKGSSKLDKSEGRNGSGDKNLTEFQIQRTSPTANAIISDQQYSNQRYRITDIQQQYEHHQLQQRLPSPNEIENSIEFHEMQTLIPKPNQQIYYNVKNDQSNILQNGNSIIKRQRTNSTDNVSESIDDNLFTKYPIALCSSTPITSKRKTISNDNQIEIDLIPKNQQQNNKYNYENNKLTKISSSPNFTTTNNTNINNLNPVTTSVVNNTPEISSVPIKILSKSIIPVESEQDNYSITNNDLMKIFLPHKKHSIFLDEADIKLVNGHDNSPLKHSTDSNSNTSPVDNNSQIKLLGYNNSFCDNNFCQNSTTPINNDSNCTASTFLNFDDSNSINNTKTIGNQLIKTNWNHRRPIVDPNG